MNTLEKVWWLVKATLLAAIILIVVITDIQLEMKVTEDARAKIIYVDDHMKGGIP